MHRPGNNRGKVSWLNASGQLQKNLAILDKTWSFPHYITENKNGDVVVSDSGKCSVEVTESGGKHRFSFKPSTFKLATSYLFPKGICTDPLLNILVCDDNNVFIIDKDQFFDISFKPKTFT